MNFSNIDTLVGINCRYYGGVCIMHVPLSCFSIELNTFHLSLSPHRTLWIFAGPCRVQGACQMNVVNVSYIVACPLSLTIVRR